MSNKTSTPQRITPIATVSESDFLTFLLSFSPSVFLFLFACVCGSINLDQDNRLAHLCSSVSITPTLLNMSAASPQTSIHKHFNYLCQHQHITYKGIRILDCKHISRKGTQILERFHLGDKISATYIIDEATAGGSVFWDFFLFHPIRTKTVHIFFGILFCIFRK